MNIILCPSLIASTKCFGLLSPVQFWFGISDSLQCSHRVCYHGPINDFYVHKWFSYCYYSLIISKHYSFLLPFVLYICFHKNNFHIFQIPEPDTSIQSVSIDPEGKMVAAVNNKGSCFIWSISSAEYGPSKLSPRHHIAAHRRYALSCSLSPDSKYVTIEIFYI